MLVFEYSVIIESSIRATGIICTGLGSAFDLKIHNNNL